MKVIYSVCAILFMLVATVNTTRAGISVDDPRALYQSFTVSFGLGTPLPGKWAYVSVVKPDGTVLTIGSAQNVPDGSQTVYFQADKIGWYEFRFEYSHESEGIPRQVVPPSQWRYIEEPQDNILWGNASVQSPSPPNSTQSIEIGFTNSGPTTWNGNYYLEFQDHNGTPLEYLSVAGYTPSQSGFRERNYTIPNVGGIGTVTYHVRAIHGDVHYFGSVKDVPVIIDYAPTVNMSAPTQLNLDQPVTITSQAHDLYSNLTVHVLDYKPPGGAWVWGSTAAGTRWEGGPSSTNNLPPLVMQLSTVGVWQFHTRSADSYGQLSAPVSKDVNVVMPNPSCAVFADITSIVSGGEVRITVNALDARYININQVGPNNGYYGDVSVGNEFPPNGPHKDLGMVHVNAQRTLTLTLHTNPSNPGVPVTYTFRGAVSAGGAWVESPSTVAVTVTPAATVPIFASHPQNASVTSGSAATFTAVAIGSPAPSHRWQRNVNGIWTDLNSDGIFSGVTTTTLTVNGATVAMTGYQFRCKAQNSAGTVYSNGATLTVTQGDITVGMVGRWTFDESGGPSALDSVNGNTGTLFGSPSRIQGRVGGALSFNGSSSYVMIPASSVLEMTNSSVTVAAWIRNSTTYGSERMIVEHSVWSAGNTYQLTTAHSSHLMFNSPNMYLNEGSVGADFGFSDGQWHHVVGVYDDSGNIAILYVDGVPRANKPTQQSIGGGGPSPTYIGSRGGYGLFFAGDIDDVRIYNRALTQPEVTSMYAYQGGNQGAPLFSLQPNPVTVTAPSPANFTAGATGTPQPTYKWQFRTNSAGNFADLNNNAPYSGANSSQLNISNTTGLNDYEFRCVATNSAGSTFSNPAKLTVNTSSGGDIMLGLVAWWRFDETQGSSADDSSSGGHTGTLQGAPGRVYGQVGAHALSFDGIDDYVGVQNLNWNGGPVTVAFWNYVATTPGGYSSAFGANSSILVNRFQAHAPWLDNVLYWDYGTAEGNGRISVNYSSYYGKWTHVTLVSAGSGGNFKAIYLDGILVNSSGTSDSPTSLSGFRVGSLLENGGAAYHPGSIDDFRIYNRVLSQNDITALVAYGATVTPPVITTQPVPQTVPVGTNATFTVGATGNPAPTFRWQRSVTGTWFDLANDSTYSGVTTSTLTVSGTTSAMTGDQFRCKAENSSGTVYSNGAILTVAQGDITAGMVGRWTFDESNGPSAFDSVNGNTGTLVGSPSRIQGRVGGALTFNGSSSYVMIPASSVLEMTNSSVTVAAWIRNSTTYGSERMIVEHSVWSAGNTYQLTTAHSSHLMFNSPNMYLNEGGSFGADFGFSDGQWHHVVGVYDDSGNIAILYVDGVARANRPTQQSIGGGGPSPTYIGSRGGVGLFFSGDIDDVRIYNRALTQPEVTSIYEYQGGNQGATPQISSSLSTLGTVGTAFSYQITATNGPTSYGAANLPANLSLNAGSGLITGIPTAAGTTSIGLTATNAAGTSPVAILTLTVTNGGDSDGDGVSDVIEQLLQTNPQNPGATDVTNGTVRLKIQKP